VTSKKNRFSYIVLHSVIRSDGANHLVGKGATFNEGRRFVTGDFSDQQKLNQALFAFGAVQPYQILGTNGDANKVQGIENQLI
jgi:hypothetical protein